MSVRALDVRYYIGLSPDKLIDRVAYGSRAAREVGRVTHPCLALHVEVSMTWDEGGGSGMTGSIKTVMTSAEDELQALMLVDWR